MDAARMSIPPSPLTPWHPHTCLCIVPFAPPPPRSHVPVPRPLCPPPPSHVSVHRPPPPSPLPPFTLVGASSSSSFTNPLSAGKEGTGGLKPYFILKCAEEGDAPGWQARTLTPLPSSLLFNSYPHSSFNTLARAAMSIPELVAFSDLHLAPPLPSGQSPPLGRPFASVTPALSRD